MKEKNQYGHVVMVPEVEDLLNAKNYGKEHTVEDWPYGRSKRCIMKFSVEKGPGDKERFVKQSTFNGRPNKPKKATYAKRVVLIEIEGKMARVELAKNFPMISCYVEDGNFMNPTFHDEEFKVLLNHFFG